ncbi:MAG: DUF1295 domain-containing protein [Patescibacteria group bacterium]
MITLINACIVSVIVGALLATVLFLESAREKDAYLARLGWGLYPMAIAVLNVFIFHHQTIRPMILFVLMFVLGAQHIIAFRYREKEREEAGREGIQLYVKSYLLRGIVGALVALPIVIVANTPYYPPLGYVDLLGCIVWLCGFIYRYTHLKFAQEKGEAVQWWGIWLIATTIPLGLYTVVSPIIATAVVYYLHAKKTVV